MMRTIPQREWPIFFRQMSKALAGSQAEVEVAALDLGDQIAAEWLPLVGVTYDEKDDLLDVAFDRTDHLIRHPRQILVEETTTGLASLAVLDATDARQIVRFKRPLRLPSAAPR
jgi:hypothetical protein